LDFIEKMKRSRKGNRLTLLKSAIAEYAVYDKRRKLGKNVVVLSETDKEALRESRKNTIAQFETEGMPVPYDVLPWLKSEQDCEDWIRGMSNPHVEDGSDQAMVLMACGYLAAGAAGLVPSGDECRCVRHLSRTDLLSLSTDLRLGLDLVLANPLLPDIWGEEYWQHFVQNAENLKNALATAFRD